MKILKTITIVSLFSIGLATSVFASWWNPLTWFNKKAPRVSTPLVIPPELQSIISITSSTSVKDIRPMQYALHAAPATTTQLTFPGITLSAPWTDLMQSKISPSFGIWRFKNKQVITLSISTSTTKAVWVQQPGMEKILPVNSLNDYELEKMIWESDIHDAALIVSKKSDNVDDVRKGMLASIKARNYFTPGISNKLLEFENQNGIKGLINTWKKDERNDYYIIYFYPSPGHQYEMRLTTDEDSVMDSIVNSIKIK